MALLMTIALLIYMGFEIFDILLSSVLAPKTRNILHDVALMLVILKAIKILIFFVSTHRVGIKYLVEISIIAPAIEIIFAPDRHTWWLIVIFAFFSITNLIIYLVFYERIKELDQDIANQEAKCIPGV
ncbi:hypothetical protein KKF03_02375 [Patescibacteria group bacterium]|nr:hypothetical protein [Patescibacteria group bacterium]